MEFETLKSGKFASRRRLIVGVTLVVLVLVASLTFYHSYAKYRVTQSFKLAEGTISNYSTADVNVAVYWGEKAKSTFPDKTSGYEFDKVVCDVESIANKATWSNESWSLNMEVTEPVKCWIYFTYTPEMTLSLTGDYTSKTVTATTDFKSTNLYSVSKYFYSLDGTNFVESASATYTFSEWQGTKLTATRYTVYVKAVDVENNTTDVITSTIWLDDQAPSLAYQAKSTTAGNNGWYKAYTMSLTATDTENNVDSFSYCVTTSSSCTPNTAISTNSSKSVTFDYTFGTSASAQRVCATAVDSAGNSTGVTCSEAYKVDVTKPSASMTASTTTKAINISVTASDVGSGVATYYYSIDGGKNYTSSSNSSYSVNAAAGTYSIYAYVVDSAGNQSTVQTTSVVLKSSAKDVILANMPTVTTRSSFNSVVTASTTGTIYTASDDDGTSYYFSGAPTDNWVKFAGFYWRIIRINGDGTIRMIYQGTAANTTGTGTQTTTSAFNSSYNNNMYVGYMYTSGNVHGLGTSSTIKGVLDSWYDSNLASYASYIDTNAGFCGDRTPSTSSSSSNGSGGTGTTTTYYGDYIRYYNSGTPVLTCANSSDLYTVSSSSKGNKALSKPIGLINMNEVWLGGGYQASNSSYYLYTGQYYWTMSPFNTNSYGYASVFYVNSDGGLFDNDVGWAGPGVRPVINLKSDTAFADGGTGTSSNPYVVS